MKLGAKLISWITILSVLILIFGVSSTLAQQKFTGLIIRTPAEYSGFTYELFLDPGETRCDSFTAQHDWEEQDKSVILYTMASDLEIDPDTGRPMFPEKTLYLDHEYSLARWITVEKDYIFLDRWGKEEKVNFCVDVPSDATPGSHYAVILLSNVTKDEYIDGKITEDVHGPTIGSRSGINVIVTVSGSITNDLYVRTFDVLDIDLNPGILFGLFEYLPLNFVTEISNNGNQFVKPSGDIFIHQGDLTNPVKKFIFNPNAERILPKASTGFRSLWGAYPATESPLYIYKAENKAINPQTGNEIIEYTNTLGFDPNKIGDMKFGRYFATLQMTFRDINGDLARYPDITVEFWIIPWKLILLLIALFVITYYLLRFARQDKITYISRKSSQYKATKK